MVGNVRAMSGAVVSYASKEQQPIRVRVLLRFSGNWTAQTAGTGKKQNSIECLRFRGGGGELN